MSTWSAVTWNTARAGGFAAYVLLLLAVTAGLVLRNRWQSDRWPRLITNELHGYLSLLALVFIAIHVVAVWTDPFTHFGIGEIVVPFASHYRPLWMGLGIVALYLLLAVWATSKVRTRMPYHWWRRIHGLAFAVYVAATVHGLGAGSDTRTPWALGLYLSGALAVGFLTARRLLVPAGRGDRPRPLLAATSGVVVVAVAAWALTGPLATGWGRRHPRVAIPVGVAIRTSSRPQPSLPGTVRTPFRASFNGTISVSDVSDLGYVTVRIDGALTGGTRDHIEILLHGVPLDGGGVEMRQSRVRMGTTTPLYVGQITALRGTSLVADVRAGRQRVRLGVDLRLGADGTVAGTVRGRSLSARTAT